MAFPMVSTDTSGVPTVGQHELLASLRTVVWVLPWGHSWCEMESSDVV
jgi:hypothetical protein